MDEVEKGVYGLRETLRGRFIRPLIDDMSIGMDGGFVLKRFVNLNGHGKEGYYATERGFLRDLYDRFHPSGEASIKIFMKSIGEHGSSAGIELTVEVDNQYKYLARWYFDKFVAEHPTSKVSYNLLKTI